MTEQKTKFTNEVVGLFDLTGTPGMYEAMAADMAVRGPEQMAREFKRVEELLRGLDSTAEDSLGLGASLILGEARALAELARHICEDHAKE